MEFLNLKNFLAELFFPKLCVNCQAEGDYLCEDCFSLIDFLPANYQKGNNLSRVICAVPYRHFIVKKLIAQFKYGPLVKDLAKTLAALIIHHLKISERQAPALGDFLLVPVPLTKKRLKERGFNQTKEIGKELSGFLKAPLTDNVLLKVKETPSQAELSGKARKQNLRTAFAAKNVHLIRGKKILLLDDVFTTGSTMEEAARVLREAGAKEIWGLAVARE